MSRASESRNLGTPRILVFGLVAVIIVLGLALIGLVVLLDPSERAARQANGQADMRKGELQSAARP